MAHERDEKYEGQEDSEYHFSDDQISYETDTAEGKPATSSNARSELIARLVYYKRPLIGVGVFIVLIFLVYKIIAPNTSTPATDIAQTSTTTTTTTSTVKPAKATTIEPANTMQVAPAEPQPAAVTNPPNLAPTAQAPVAVPSAPEQQQSVQQVPPTTTMPPPIQQQQAVQPPPMPVQQQAPVETTTTTTTVAPPGPGMNPPVQTTQTVPAQPGMPATSAMSVPDRLTVIETQTAKMQSDLSQKLTEQEAQNTALQGKLQDLNMRMASIEATLIRLGRVMHDMKGGRAMDEALGANNAEPVRMMAKPAPAPRATYAVQAIIPGRAWLKSENGDTVTVAEGDVVKELGRIVKIDPYDGVVQVDANGRLISLSYGAANSE